MSWKIKLNNGRIDAFYDDQLVLEGVELRGYDQEDEIKFLLAPYGKPYPVAAPAGEQIVYILKLVPQNTGPTDIIMEIFCGPLRLALRLYPRKPLGFKLSGMVHWGWEPYLCRIEPGQFKDVVQAALGPANSLLCDCLFDKWTDRVLRFNADDIFQIKANPSTGDFWVESQLFTQFGSIPEILAVEVINHFVTEHRSMPHYVPYDRTHHPLPPSGWESWYCYGRQTSEEILIRITDWLAKHLKPFGCEVVQWDDGYQDENWLEWRRDLFPHGGKWIADYIHSKGFKPGIWVLPQSLGKIDSKLLETKPDWLLRKPDGEVFRGFANYPYVDPTHPEVKKEWFQKIFHTMAREWGIDFFKIDGEGEMQQWYALCRDQLYDPSLTPDEAYRGWLKIIRAAIGQERTLLICATQWRAMGFGDCCRTGTDVGEQWPAVEPALRATFSNYWMHTIAWYCDPDVLIVRPPLTLEQARSWASLLGLSGQVLLNSDPVHELPEERVELLRRIFPAQDIRPMDLWSHPPHGPYPQIWDLKVATNWGQWDVVGLFRWFEENAAEVKITTELLGLPTGRYVLYDVWEKSYLGELGNGRTFQIDPGACRVLCIRALTHVPLLLGTNRHITQGYPDLLNLKWDSTHKVMTGQSTVVENDPYQIRILVESNGKKYLPDKIETDCCNVTYHLEDGVLLVTLTSKISQRVNWQIQFKK